MSIKEERYGIGADILVVMEANGDLPLPNQHRLTSVMEEYFNNGDYIDDLRERGLTWRGTADYWRNNLANVRRALRQSSRLYFEFVREQGTWKGLWKFATKTEYLDTVRREHASIGTRVEHHNEKINDGNDRWKMGIPIIADVPLLSN